MLDTMEPSELARALGSLPKIKRERVCAVCGKTFLGTARALYCSASCKLKAQYQRRKAKDLGTKRETEIE